MPILWGLSVFFKMKMNCTKYKFSEIEIKSTSESDKKADSQKQMNNKRLMGINLVNKH